MAISAIFDRSDFEAALHASSEVGPGDILTGLAAPIDSALWGRISQAWDSVEHALRQAYQHGLEFAQDAVNKAIAATEQVLQTAGTRARDAHEAFLSRLQQYLTVVLNSALARVAGAVTVAERTFTLDQIELSNKISLTGSLKVNITEIAALTGAGEITVVARYGLASASTVSGRSG